MLLYKYRNFSDIKSLEYTLDSLKNKYLYFSRPSELNDPFDCQMQMDLNASDEEIATWIENNKSKMIPGNKFSTVDSFKKELEKGNAQAFLQIFSSSRIVETNHVLSLTTECLNESMWALYAGKYNGICIGFNINSPDLIFEPIKILATDIFTHQTFMASKKRIKFERIYYDNDGKHRVHILKNSDTEMNNVIYNLAHKKKCWETESEYRAIIFDTDLIDIPRSTLSTKTYYDDSLLEEILFGYQVPDSFIYSVRKVVEASYKKTIKFYKVSPDLYNYVLKRELI